MDEWAQTILTLTSANSKREWGPLTMSPADQTAELRAYSDLRTLDAIELALHIVVRDLVR